MVSTQQHDPGEPRTEGPRVEAGRITRPDGERVLVRAWLPAGEPLAVLQISHGMAEHSKRYDRFARALTAAGWGVYASDHRGHGGTAGHLERAGVWPRNGWSVVVEDLHAVHELAVRRHPGVKQFLFGHSMGSMLAREYAMRWSEGIDGLVLSGPVLNREATAAVGRRMARAEARLRGREHISAVISRVNTKTYNRPFEPARTPYDWLSRDEAEVDKYIADPWCGFDCSDGFFDEILTNQSRVHSRSHVALVSRELPVLVMGGSADPVGCRDGAVEEIVGEYGIAGLTDVVGKVWEGARHELLNETNRDEITDHLVDWLERRRTGRIFD
ncbi:alpha/beta hydrolase [Propionibacterium australiense]|uniref:Alpha/Beta hydrolase fold n=1 Tax=Propionibacterium australiense TaxID=119981 RepID=A0A383S3B1_9ACTN|nr:alpha/beta hydrolase [Propionibacterium australiense]RLP08890.1 alpha/beta fold hydrolase [Propionibacterium australiense]RLP11734.1 alpha/beta fold hydrolase [Propionibacterium australiense]SYZ32480.1 Alpha/Beta hydrolase fold [Propionibacterium australiense]VEH90127.1 lysophospholipase L2 [Propionibacterium australiense]